MHRQIYAQTFIPKKFVASQSWKLNFYKNFYMQIVYTKIPPNSVDLSCVNMAESCDPRSEQQPAGWNQPCLEEHLAEIATSITEWRDISPFLGLTEAEEHEILGSAPHSVCSQKIAMLRLWKRKKGIAATYNRLCQAFRRSERIDLEDKMKKILAESQNSLVDGEGELIVIANHNYYYNVLSQALRLSHYMLESQPLNSILIPSYLTRPTSGNCTCLCPTATPLNDGPTSHDVSSYS